MVTETHSAKYIKKDKNTHVNKQVQLLLITLYKCLLPILPLDRVAIVDLAVPKEAYVCHPKKRAVVLASSKNWTHRHSTAQGVSPSPRVAVDYLLGRTSKT